MCSLFPTWHRRLLSGRSHLLRCLPLTDGQSLDTVRAASYSEYHVHFQGHLTYNQYINTSLTVRTYMFLLYMSKIWRYIYPWQTWLDRLACQICGQCHQQWQLPSVPRWQIHCPVGYHYVCPGDCSVHCLGEDWSAYGRRVDEGPQLHKYKSIIN